MFDGKKQGSKISGNFPVNIGRHTQNEILKIKVAKGYISNAISHL
jgi:hypothetical protein